MIKKIPLKHLRKLACIMAMTMMLVVSMRAETHIAFSFAEESYADDCDTSTMHMMWDKLKVIKDFESVLNDYYNEAHRLDLNGDGVLDSLRIIAIQKETPIELLLQACVAKNIWADVVTMHITEASVNIGGDTNLLYEDDGYRDISLNLSLEAVLVSLYETNSLYAFEEKLNSSLHLSNIDCNNDGMVDNLFVEEFIEDGLHMICINAMLSAIEFQEIACIYALRLPQNNRVVIEIMGDPYIFGNNCIVSPHWYNNPQIFRDIFSYRSPYISHRDGSPFGNKKRWTTNHYQDEMRNYISMRSYLINSFSYPAVLSGYFFAHQRSRYSAYETYYPNRAYHTRNHTDASKNAYSENQKTNSSTTPLRRQGSVSASDNQDGHSVRFDSTSTERSFRHERVLRTKISMDSVSSLNMTSSSVWETTIPKQKTDSQSTINEPYPKPKVDPYYWPTQKQESKPIIQQQQIKPQPTPKQESKPIIQQQQSKPQPTPKQEPRPNIHQQQSKPHQSTSNAPQPQKPQPSTQTEKKQQNPQPIQSSPNRAPVKKQQKK